MVIESVIDGEKSLNSVIKLKNYIKEIELKDTLHLKAKKPSGCSDFRCSGSIVRPNSGSENHFRTDYEIENQAKMFLEEYYQHLGSANGDSYFKRINEIRSEIKDTGTYELTYDELNFGAKLAWRNAPRCIARNSWSNMKVIDARHVKSAKQMFDVLCEHLKYATNGGNIRVAITIFGQRRAGKSDFRVWNSQLVAYAGYRQSDGSILGDPLNAEFTEVCQKLGWQGKGGKWDILPLVLCASGQEPEWFNLPPELTPQVKLIHPQFKWFEQLGLQWNALPSVSGLLLDCGGIEFPAAPFNGWYISSEIGARNLCDQQRFNILEEVGELMKLDTSTNISLWKDKVLVEVNIAVLHSFHKMNITIVDHHTASEVFMKHLQNEHRDRGGCPADWVWIVPPISGSLTSVFHQEMSLYHLKPSYEFQEPAWKTHLWNSCPRGFKDSDKMRFTFRQIAKSVFFTVSLYMKVLSRRSKITILYASESGNSENYAGKLGKILRSSFHVNVSSMSDFSVEYLLREKLVIVITSTYGNGGPPTNGQKFAQQLKIARENGRKFFTQTSFAVFALGSSAYVNFCQFGKEVDQILRDFGGTRAVDLTFGDELNGQLTIFRNWVDSVRLVCGKLLQVDINDNITNTDTRFVNTTTAGKQNPACYNLLEIADELSITEGLSSLHRNQVSQHRVKISKNLHEGSKDYCTFELIFERGNLQYFPGDHIVIFPCNEHSLVQKLLKLVSYSVDPNQSVRITTASQDSLMQENWNFLSRLPPSSLWTIFSRYLDITSTPSQSLLSLMSKNAIDNEEKSRLEQLATDIEQYDQWKYAECQTVIDVLQEFTSVQTLDVIDLMTHLPILQPRYYSISSSPNLHQNEIFITVSLAQFQIPAKNGVIRYGLCSNYLKNLKMGDNIECFVKRASSFHLPVDLKKPIILIGAGTGIAPFRSFWNERFFRSIDLKDNTGTLTLIFGCRSEIHDLFKREKELMAKRGIIKRELKALSREANLPKEYVQDIVRRESQDIYHDIVNLSGHVYVCGDSDMAAGVHVALKDMLCLHGDMCEDAAMEYLEKMKREMRYHEDVYGIKLRKRKN